MAKKNKDEVPTASSVANRDIIQRLNFLYQASVYLNTVPSDRPEGVSDALAGSSTSQNVTTSGLDKQQKRGKKEKGRKNAVKRAVTASDLARTYVATMKSVGQKTTVKIDPAVKRTLCKGCNMTLVPGATASVRVKNSPVHGHIMVYTCSGCHTARRIPAPPTLSAATGGDVEAQVAFTAAPLTAPLPSAPAAAAAAGEAPMDIEPTHAVEAAPATTRRKGKGKGVQPRLPPLFARDVGHVVFRGNERLVDEGRGDGVYIT
ncbi:putative rpr2-domain-containing protein [Lyophyllum shimeji]|uniref:Rpr2-domain-containing protein n=1 Tax=Lyophyllum shimeji TaxID=47721 RepID=A0A9P3UJH2_LYOSH|nr:putative rpr2-domain-containing protein [Lyophyllum shimeji]